MPVRFLTRSLLITAVVVGLAAPVAAQVTPPTSQQTTSPPQQQTPPPDPVQEPPPPPPIQSGPAVLRSQAAGQRRQVRRLFGEGTVTGPNRQSLLFRATINAAYDNNLLAEGGPAMAADPRLQVSGTYALFNPELAYARRGRRVTTDAAVGSAFRYYPDPSELLALSTWATTSLGVSFGRSSSLAFSAGGSHQPYSGFAPFPGLANLLAASDYYEGGADFAQTRRPAFSYNAAIDFTRQLGRESSLSIGYALRRTDYRDESMRDLDDRGVHVQFTRRLTQTLGLRLGYAYRQGTFSGMFFVEPTEDLSRIRSHDIDVGVDFSKALGRTRRTTVGFTTGSTILATPVQNLYRVLASAHLSRAIGRSGLVRADYRRGLQLVEGLNVPVFTDAVTATGSAMAGPRWEFSASGGYTTGDFGAGLMTGDGGFDTYTGTARAQYGLSRYFALQVEYFYYHYLFPPGTALVPGFARGLDRQGVRGGITLWAPLVR